MVIAVSLFLQRSVALSLHSRVELRIYWSKYITGLVQILYNARSDNVNWRPGVLQISLSVQSNWPLHNESSPKGNDCWLKLAVERVVCFACVCRLANRRQSLKSRRQANWIPLHYFFKVTDSPSALKPTVDGGVLFRGEPVWSDHFLARKKTPE